MVKTSRVDDVHIDHSTARIVMLGVPDLPGVAARVFMPLAEQGIGSEMIVQNNMRGGMTDIGFLVKKERLDDAIVTCRRVATEIEAQGVSFSTEIARITIVGEGLADDPQIAANTFAELAAIKVNIEMIVSNALYVTCVVSSAEAQRAAEALKAKFMG